ncbi:MAG TPA: CinA family nicotinamide mononucleotide deamidase-related protein [Polyangia bacterium]|nr:CinA family nicotinamide mononucleotide deamidase-related protein [Polyangia bacterium]
MSSPEGQVERSTSPKPQRAVLLAIGDEVLRGEIANTNGTFIADRLFEAGFSVVEHAVVSDDPIEIRGALVRLRATADVIVATGGLGPTEDDRTVDVVADIFGTGTVPDEPSLGAMKKRFSTHGFELTPNNLRQVRIPVGAKALPNSAGIAPGFVVRLGGADAYFLPGVPREMERMYLDQVAPRLSVRMAEAGVPRAAVRTWHVYGMGESHIDHRLAGLLNGVDPSVTATLHFRTSHPVNHVKVVVRGKSVEEEQATLERIDAELRKRIGPGIYAVDGESFPAAVARSLRAQDPPATLAIAESCTGGLAGELITSESGASSFFRGSIVAYSDDVKTSVLGVKAETLADFGAVSEPCAREMAEGAKRVCGSSVAVSITGVAGPGGGSPDKPVGTVCFAVCGPGTTRTSTKLFAGNRERVRVAAAYYALDLARRYFDTRKR